MLHPPLQDRQILIDNFDSIPAIAWTADPETFAFTWVSRGAETILGYPAEAWTDSPQFVREHIHPDDRSVIAFCRSETAQLRDHELLYRMSAADGRIVWIRDHVHVCTEGGKVVALCGVMVDATAERSAHAALARSEESYRRLVDTFPDAIGVHTGGRFVYANSKFVELFGAVHPLEVLGRPVLSFVHPSYRDLVKTRQAQIAVGQNVPMAREKLMRIDGTPFDAEVMAIPVVFKGARAVQVIARDVTQRIRTDERLRLLALGTNEAIWEGDYATGEFWTNECYRTLFGEDVRDFESARMRWEESIHPDDRERVLGRLVERVESGADLWYDEYRIRTVTGQYIWVLDRGRRVLSENGQPLRVIGALLDVTALRESELRFRQIVEQAQDIIYTTDTEGRITSLNPAFERITGFKAADWIGRPMVETIVPDQQYEAYTRYLRTMAGVHGGPQQFRVHGASRTIEVEGAGQQRIVNGQVAGTIGIARDVTERNALQRKIEQEKRVASLGQLAASLAHEFNQVLMTIQSFSDLAARTAGSDRASEAYAGIGDAVARGKRMTSEILSFANPKPPQIEAIDVTPWLHAIVQSANVLLPATIEVRIAPHENARILVDRYQLEEVVMNLVVNARDAMPAGGTIRIEFEREAGGRGRLTVRDTGTGIAPELLPSLFEPYFTTKRGGTGLGLAIARRLIEAQDGRIEVESTGEGTAFHLFLPLA